MVDTCNRWCDGNKGGEELRITISFFSIKQICVLLVFQVQNLLSSKILHCNALHQFPFISCFQNITYFVFQFGLIWCNPHYSILEKFLNFDSLCKIFDIMRITKKKPLFENPTTHFPGPGRQHRSHENSLPGICWNLLLENSFSGATDTLGWLLNLPTGCLANPVWGLIYSTVTKSIKIETRNVNLLYFYRYVRCLRWTLNKCFGQRLKQSTHSADLRTTQHRCKCKKELLLQL